MDGWTGRVEEDGKRKQYPGSQRLIRAISYKSAILVTC